MVKMDAYETESPFRTSHERGKRSDQEMTSTYIAREGNEVKAKEQGLQMGSGSTLQGMVL